MKQTIKPAGGSPIQFGGRRLAIILAIVLIVALGLLTMEFAQIDEGQRGIVITQGAVEMVHEPGIFFRPFAPFTRVEIVNVKRQSRAITQNVASKDKQLYDIDIAVDYSRDPSPDALRAQYGEIGASDEQLTRFLDGFINDAVKSASTAYTLDEVLADRGGLAEKIRQFLSSPGPDERRGPVEQLHIRLEAVKVIDIKVGETYAKLLSEKANLEVQIETEEKRRQQIEAQQSNNLFQAEQEAAVALTKEKGLTAAALEAAERDARVRAIQGRYWRENPELYELRKRELMVELVKSGNIWFIDPNTDITLLLNQMMDSQLPPGSLRQVVPSETESSETPPGDAAPATAP